MVSVREAPAQKLIDNVALQLKSNEKVEMPSWAVYVKTGVHVERKPENKDWWYTRSASILRKIYIEHKVGVGHLRVWYGGRKNRGSRPEHHKQAGGKIIRVILQQLEAAGYVKKDEKGRILTPQGRKLLDKAALELRGEKIEKPRTGGGTKKGVGAGKTEAPALEKPTGTGSEGKTVKTEPSKPAAGGKA